MEEVIEDISGKRFFYLSNIPPAFSGVLVDWSIGSKEITATIIDLIIRGYLDVSGEKAMVTKKRSPRGFERDFIHKVFGKKKELSIGDISDIAYKKASTDLMRIIATGMIDEGIIQKDFQKKLADMVKRSTARLAGANALTGYGVTASSATGEQARPMPRPIILPGWIFKIVIGAVVVSFVVLAVLFPPSLLITIPSMALLAVMYSVVKSIVQDVEKETGGSMDWMLTARGRQLKQDSVRLMDFLTRYPLLEDRLANVMVGHAVAFGIGKQWMKRLGKGNEAYLKLIEQFSTKWETTYYFMDFEKYVREFMIPDVTVAKGNIRKI